MKTDFMTPWYKISNSCDIPSPTVLIFLDRVQENIRRMVLASGDVSRLRPHVKTHKLPQIVAMKLLAGITKFKTATIAEAEMTAAAGGLDVLLAYQMVGPNVKRFLKLMEAFPSTRFSTLVDNLETLRQLSDTATAQAQIIEIFVDLNVGMNRTGIVPDEPAAAIVRVARKLPGVRVVGFHAYDGHLHEPKLTDLSNEVEQAFLPVWRLRERLGSEGFGLLQVVASGTPTSSILARQSDVETCPGTTVFWDAGQQAISPELDYLPAAVVFSRVISKPTSDTICVDLGHKAIASEMPQPRVHWFGLLNPTVIMHSEEHLVLKVDNAAELAVGSVLYGLPKHVCPTIALHSHVCPVTQQLAGESWRVVARDRFISV